MDYVIEFQEDRPYDVHVRIVGVADVADFEAYLADLLFDERWRPGMTILGDLTALDASSFGPREVRNVAELNARYQEEFGAARIAIAAGTPLNYGLLRMWQAFIDAHSKQQTQVYRTLDEARASLDPH